jgi:uncharacterized protein
MLKNAVLFAALVTCGASAFAATLEEKPVDEKITLSIELLQLVHFDDTIKNMQGQISAMLEQQFESYSTCESARPVLHEFSTELTEKMMGKLSDEGMKVDVAAVYADVFSVEELREINAFFKSPLGQKMIEKMPELMQKSMLITQSRMKSMMPELQSLGEQYGARIRAAAKTCEQVSDTTGSSSEE